MSYYTLWGENRDHLRQSAIDINLSDLVKTSIGKHLDKWLQLLSKDLIKKVFHFLPGPAIRFRVVGSALGIVIAGVRVGERMNCL